MQWVVKRWVKLSSRSRVNSWCQVSHMWICVSTAKRREGNSIQHIMNKLISFASCFTLQSLAKKQSLNVESYKNYQRIHTSHGGLWQILTKKAHIQIGNNIFVQEAIQFSIPFDPSFVLKRQLSLAQCTLSVFLHNLKVAWNQRSELSKDIKSLCCANNFLIWFISWYQFLPFVRSTSMWVR